MYVNAYRPPRRPRLLTPAAIQAATAATAPAAPDLAEASLPMRPVALSGANGLEANRAIQAAEGINTNPMRPAATPGSTPTVGTGSGVGSFARRLGKGIADNPIGVANAALGVAGAITYATTKTPSVPAYQEFTPSLAPVTGMDAGQKQTLRNRIVQGQLRAGQATTADANLSTAARLQAQQTAGEQEFQLESQDQQILQQNLDQRQQQQMQVDQTNQQGREQRKMAKFDQENQQAQAKRAGGAALAQGAATYFTQAEAAGRQADQAKLQAQYSQTAAAKQQRYTQLLTLMNAGNLPPQQLAAYQAELARMESEATAPATATPPPTRAHGGVVPVLRLARGGRVSRELSVTTHAQPGIEQKMMADFQKSMTLVTQEAMRQHGQLIRDIFRARATRASR